MTTIEAQLLSNGDEVGHGYYVGIVMQSTPRLVAIYWETQKMGETTAYSKGSAELRDMVLKRKAQRLTLSTDSVPQKAAAEAQRNGATNGGSHRSAGMASPLVK
jgi:hypothetical protein